MTYSENESGPLAFETVLKRICESQNEDLLDFFKQSENSAAPVVINHILTDQSLNDSEWQVIDAIHDFVINNAIEWKTLKAWHDDGGEFEIVINRYGPVYFISAIEFDHIGYFLSSEDAIEHATEEFEPFLTPPYDADEYDEET